MSRADLLNDGDESDSDRSPAHDVNLDNDDSDTASSGEHPRQHGEVWAPDTDIQRGSVSSLMEMFDSPSRRSDQSNDDTDMQRGSLLSAKGTSVTVSTQRDDDTDTDVQRGSVASLSQQPDQISDDQDDISSTASQGTTPDIEQQRPGTVAKLFEDSSEKVDHQDERDARPPKDEIGVNQVDAQTLGGEEEPKDKLQNLKPLNENEEVGIDHDLEIGMGDGADEELVAEGIVEEKQHEVIMVSESLSNAPLQPEVPASEMNDLIEIEEADGAPSLTSSENQGQGVPKEGEEALEETLQNATTSTNQDQLYASASGNEATVPPDNSAHNAVGLSWNPTDEAQLHMPPSDDNAPLPAIQIADPMLKVPPSDNDAPVPALKTTGDSDSEMDEPRNSVSAYNEFLNFINGDTKVASGTNEDIEAQVKIGARNDTGRADEIHKYEAMDVGFQSNSLPQKDIDTRPPEESQQQIPQVTNPTPRSMLPDSNVATEARYALGSEANLSHPSDIAELEAIPVPDEPVYDATQVKSSWWKKNLRYIIVGLLIVIGALVATWVTLQSRNNNNQEVDEQMENIPSPTTQPSQSSSPSQNPTWHPSYQPSQTTAPSSAVTGPSLQPSTGPSPQPSTSTLPTTYFSTFKWKQQGETIVEGARERSPDVRLVLSADGLTIAIGYPGSLDENDPITRPGYVKVYIKEDSGGNWQQLGPTIEGVTIGDHFGSGLSLSEDGRTIAIGAPGTWNAVATPGYAKIFTFESIDTGSRWKQLGQTLNGTAVGEYFGRSTSLSSNGTIVAISDHNYLGNKGIVRVYQSQGNGTNSSWEQLGQGIIGEAAGDKSGLRIALSADGKTLAIGAHLNDGNGDKSGHVRVYHMEGEGPSSNWTQLGKDIDGVEPKDRFASSLDISADGTVVAIGAPVHGSSAPGHVRVFHINGDSPGSNWTQVGQSIDGEARRTKSGRSVALSADGKTVAIGSEVVHDISDNSRTGHVRVYSIGSDDSSWKQLGGHIIDFQDDIDVSRYELKQSVALSSDGETLAVGSVYQRITVFDEDDLPIYFSHVKVYTVENNVNESIF